MYNCYYEPTINLNQPQKSKINKAFNGQITNQDKLEGMSEKEKSLRHVVMVAKFLDDNNPKTSLKKWIRTVSNFIDPIQFHFIWQMLVKFSHVESERTVFSLEKEKENFCVVFTDSIKRACEIWNFHVAGVQRRQRNEQNGMMHVQICCFVNKNLLLFCRSFSSPLSLVLLSYRNSATMVMWRHTSHLSCSPVGDVKSKFFSTDASTNHTIPLPNWRLLGTTKQTPN